MTTPNSKLTFKEKRRNIYIYIYITKYDNSKIKNK